MPQEYDRTGVSGSARRWPDQLQTNRGDERHHVQVAIGVGIVVHFDSKDYREFHAAIL
jgi:hypothetical protein